MGNIGSFRRHVDITSGGGGHQVKTKPPAKQFVYFLRADDGSIMRTGRSHGRFPLLLT
jgi:hypothetical protein